MNSLRPSFLLRQRFSMIGGQCMAKGISLLQDAGIVILDVDSTLIRKEGIDALADYLGKTNEIRALKNRYVLYDDSFIIELLTKRFLMKSLQKIP